MVVGSLRHNRPMTGNVHHQSRAPRSALNRLPSLVRYNLRRCTRRAIQDIARVIAVGHGQVRPGTARALRDGGRSGYPTTRVRILGERLECFDQVGNHREDMFADHPRCISCSSAGGPRPVGPVVSVDELVLGHGQSRATGAPTLRSNEHATATLGLERHGRARVIDEAADLLLKLGTFSP
jgi:hypothetical protein